MNSVSFLKTSYIGLWNALNEQLEIKRGDPLLWYYMSVSMTFLCHGTFLFRNHAWVSFVGFAESYSEVVKDGFVDLPLALQQLATKKTGKKKK